MATVQEVLDQLNNTDPTGKIPAHLLKTALTELTKLMTSKTTVDLTVAAQTTLYTVPAGKILYVTEEKLVGKVVPTGSTKTATLKIGTTSGSYAEMLNGATGAVFATAAATSLIPVNGVLDALAKYVPATLSVSPVLAFAAGTVLKADVSGASLPTTGSVDVILGGYLADA